MTVLPDNISTFRFADWARLASDGIILIDGQGRILEWNEAEAAITGLPRAETLGCFLWDVQDRLIAPERNPPDFKRLARDLILRGLAEGAGFRRVQEDEIVRPDGARRFIQSSLFAVPNGPSILACGICRDITDRKRAEDALRESELKYRGLYASLQDPFVIVGMDGRIQDCNEFYQSMLGYTRDELLQLTYKDLTPEKWHAFEADIVSRQVLRKGTSEVYEKEYRRKDGSLIPIELRTYLISDEQGRPYQMWATIRDITERKRNEQYRAEAERNLQQKADELARSNKDLEAFAHVASHDLKEPLRMIRSFTGILQDRLRASADASTIECMDFILEGANRMQRLIEDLLAYSRTGSALHPPSLVGADQALDTALENLSAALASSGAEIEREPLPPVMANDHQLIQLFQNLIGNAIKYRKPGAIPRIRIGARPAPEGKPEEWVFSVSDNGIGIEPAYHKRVFELFQRLHTREEYEGTGIGLAICKKIVERHQGRIWVESRPGEGSTFFFTLPA